MWMALVVGRGGDVGGDELRTGAEVERDVEAGDAVGFVERDGGVDVGGGVRRGAARLSSSPEMTTFDCGRFELRVGEGDLVLLHGERAA